jgi:hypothetical protein
MIPIDQALPGTLIFLPCGCGGIRGTDDPLARLPRLVVQHPCGTHGSPHVRVVSKSTLVSMFVRPTADER